MTTKVNVSKDSSCERLAILINTIAPYRIPIYGFLAERFTTLILHGGSEGNRNWALRLPPVLRVQKVWGFQIVGKKSTGTPGITDRSFIHLNIGLLWQLPLFGPSVVISNEMGLRTIIALAYGKLTGVPVWVWWGGTLYSERNISSGRRLLRSFIVRFAKRWISYGKTSTEYLESIGVARKNILQIQNCVPHEAFLEIPRPVKNWFEGLPHPVILTVGQLIARKGMDKLIEACGRLAANGAKFTLVIVGQGPERERLEQMAMANHIDNFLILPNQSQNTLNELYRAADVFVFPTLEDVWGLVVNEAMWTGIPVLCSEYAGCAIELLPQSNIFDPLLPESFDGALARAFDGTVAPPNLSKLKTWQEVASMIDRSIKSGSPVSG